LKVGVYVLQLFKIHTSDQFYFILVVGGSYGAVKCVHGH